MQPNQSKTEGSAAVDLHPLVTPLVRAANKAAKTAHQADEADREFTRLMREVFGDFDELPDGIVEAVRYGHEHNGITWDFIKQEMADDLKLSKPDTFPKRRNK